MAILGFVVLLGLVVLSLSVPRWMIGQPVEQYWMREPILYMLMGVNQLAVVVYLTLLSWFE